MSYESPNLRGKFYLTGTRLNKNVSILAECGTLHGETITMSDVPEIGDFDAKMHEKKSDPRHKKGR
jgi:hypothetical protein